MRRNACSWFSKHAAMPWGRITPAVLLVGGATLATASCATPPPQPARGPSEADRLSASLAKLAESPANTAAARLSLLELKQKGRGDAKRAAASVLQLLDAQATQQTTSREQQTHIKDVEFRLRATERALAEAQATADKHAESVERSEVARARLNKKLAAANEQLVSLREEVASLRKKLDALKQIDLERSP